MNWNEFFSELPIVGWVAVFFFIAMLGVVLFSLIHIFKNKNIRIRNFEIAEKTQKEFYQSEGKNVLDNQSSTAHNLLKKIWIDLFEEGKKLFNITDLTELFLLEDIAHLIESKLNYEVKNDLTRNHITEKTVTELNRYSEAKAIGYYRSVKASLYSYNSQLPKYDLPKILNNISINDYKLLFGEIYFSARKIAGGKLDD